jgi:predicted negative regulator of RcsB-dependent stress response
MKEADVLFQKGLHFLAHHSLDQAAVCFENALTLEQQSGGEPPAKLLSYCGYTLAFARKKWNDGLKLCKAAVEKEFFNPDLFFNLGDIYLTRGDKKNAHLAFKRGLTLAPDHPKIRSRMMEMGVRKTAVIPLLSRDNFLNKILGALFRKDD